MQVIPPETTGSEPAMSIVELPQGAEMSAVEFPVSGRVSVTEPPDDDSVQQVRRRDKDIKAKRKLNETPSMLDPVRGGA